MDKVNVAAFKAQLYFICIVTALLFAIVFYFSSSVPRTIFAFPVIFLFPGYTLVVALFPKKGDLSSMARLLLGFALSLAIVPLILFILNYAWSISLYPALISLSSFIVVISAIGWWRLKRLPGETGPTPSPHPSPGDSPSGRRGYRITLWVLLIALTISIVLFPVHITLDPSLVQSLNIFANFTLFAALFLTWMAVLLFLLFFKREGRGNDWEKLALVCIFALVFVNFWAIKTFYDQGGDSLSMLSAVKYLQEAGAMPEVHVGLSLWLFHFPGLYLFTNFLSQVSALELFTTAYLLRIFAPVLSVALLYLFCANSLKSAYFASAAVLLAMIMLTGFRTGFRPDLLAYVYLLAFLVILSRDERELFKTIPDRLIVIILLAAVTITYFMNSMAFFFILLGIYLAQKWGKEKPIGISTLLLPLVVILSWEVYWATSTFAGIVGFIPMVIEHITTGEIFTTALINMESTVGPEIPLWAGATRYVKWVFLYGFGTILALIGLLRARRLSSLKKREVGGILGILLLSLVATISSLAGHEFYRYFMYAFIFLAPIVVRLCLSFGERWRKGSLILLLVLLFTLSFPSFLVTGSSVATHNVLPEEIVAGKFLQSRYDKGDGLCVFGNGSYGSDIAWYYLPNADHRGALEYKDFRESTVRGGIDRVVSKFKAEGDKSIFVYSERIALIWYQNFFIARTDPHWLEMKEELSGEHGENIIFSNDYIHIYVPPTPD